MKKHKFIALLLVLAMMCGCTQEAVPDPGPVFDPNTVQEASADSYPVSSAVLHHQEHFQNSDGSTLFNVHLDQELLLESMPVVEAAPRVLTAQDAKDIIDAFFPDAKCYERHPKYTSQETSWTKDKLAQNLKRWKSYGYEDLVSIYGGASNLPGVMRENGDDVPYMEYWQESLDYFEKLLEKVPHEDKRTEALWHMFKETEYFVEPEEAARMDLSQDNDCIQLNVEVGEDTYYYVVSSNEKEMITHNVISLSYITPSSPSEIDWQIFLSENRALPSPTQEQLEEAKKIAQSYLDKFPIGKWVLTDVMPSDSDGTIYVRGYSAELPLPEPTNNNLSPIEVSEITFRIHPEGRLLGFSVRRSMTELVSHTGSAAQLPAETLLNHGLDHLRESKTMAYGVTEESLRQFQITQGEDVSCEITITRAVQGFSTMNTPSGGICYVPSLTLMGTPSFIGEDSGNVYCLQDITYIPTGEIPVVT